VGGILIYFLEQGKISLRYISCMIKRRKKILLIKQNIDDELEYLNSNSSRNKNEAEFRYLLTKEDIGPAVKKILMQGVQITPAE
jgi:hypothetical protein